MEADTYLQPLLNLRFVGIADMASPLRDSFERLILIAPGIRPFFPLDRQTVVA